MDTVDIPATLTAFGCLPVPAVATVLFQRTGERIARTAAGLAVCWGLALVSVFIPLAHFILVPTFLAAGIGLAIVRAREDIRLVRLRGTCPRCGKEEEFKVGGRLTPGRVLDCPACHNHLTLVADANVRAPA